MAPLGNTTAAAPVAAAAAGGIGAPNKESGNTRSDEKRALPTLGDITGIAADPEVECINLFLTPLLAGAAAAAIMNEKTTQSEAVGMEATAYVFRMYSTVFQCANVLHVFCVVFRIYCNVFGLYWYLAHE